MKRHWLRAGGVSIIWVDILFTLVDPESKMKVYENWDGAWGRKPMGLWGWCGAADRELYRHPVYAKCGFVMPLVSLAPSGEGPVGGTFS